MPEPIEARAARSAQMNAVVIEMVYKDHWVTFEIDVMELQYVAPEELWRRHVAPALGALSPSLTMAPTATTV